MKRHRKNKYLYIIIVFVLFACIGIGYAVLSSSVSITGTVPIAANTWDVHFENIRVNSDSVSTHSTPTVTKSTSLSITTTLTYPGDLYEFYVDVVNTGSIDARLESFSKTNLTTAQQKYLSYDVYYAYNEPIKQYDLLKAGNRETLRVVVKYNSDTNKTPTTAQSISLTLSLNYVQDTGEGIERARLCHRAKTLHTGKTADGSTSLTFGQIGTSGTLTAGDAFDCDVNGDGIYDATTERFYYLKDLDTDTAILLYYSNTTSSGASSSARPPYSSDSYAHNGPVTAVSALPSNWTRVGLKHSRRQIKNESNGNIITITSSGIIIYDLPIFEYNTTSRLPQRDELSSGSFLLENTPYTSTSAVYYWTETVNNAGKSGQVFVINSMTSFTSAAPSSSLYGVRPVIEVFKADMIY